MNTVVNVPNVMQAGYLKRGRLMATYYCKGCQTRINRIGGRKRVGNGWLCPACQENKP